MGFVDRLFKTPKWGVHPDDKKRPAADVPVRKLPLPARVYMPLSQHVGAHARPIVLVGQKVLKGQLIAEPGGNVSAPVHASTSGTVIAIGEVTAPHASGLGLATITIEADGEDRWCELFPLENPFEQPAEEIIKRTAAAGVVGLGGATFPAAVKFSLGRRLEVSTLIVNGGECEPYLSSDDRVMRDHADQVVDGARLIMRAIGARRALVGIENNKPEAIEAMKQAAAEFDDVIISPVPAHYPMGSDKQLVEMLTGKELPADARAAESGVLVHNVSTCAAVHKAIRYGQPLVERIVTVNGGALAKPGNLFAPIGTLVEELVAFCEPRETPARLVMGGPMMGSPLPHGKIPLVKGISGLLAFDAEEARVPEAGPCIRCGACTRACPMYLLPLDMAAHVRADALEGAEKLGLGDCIACGCCAYICPSHIPLVQYFNYAKGELWERERSKLRNDATKRLVEQRAERKEREAKEKAEAAARRKAERDAAKAKLAAEAAAEAAAANKESNEVSA